MILIYSNIKKNKIHRNRLNQVDATPIPCKQTLLKKNFKELNKLKDVP